MKVEDFEKRLAQRLEGVLMNADNSGSVAFGFNSGARTMYNLALVIAYEMKAEEQQEVG